MCCLFGESNAIRLQLRREPIIEWLVSRRHQGDIPHTLETHFQAIRQAQVGDKAMILSCEVLRNDRKRSRTVWRLDPLGAQPVKHLAEAIGIELQEKPALLVSLQLLLPQATEHGGQQGALHLAQGRPLAIHELASHVQADDVVLSDGHLAHLQLLLLELHPLLLQRFSLLVELFEAFIEGRNEACIGLLHFVQVARVTFHAVVQQQTAADGGAGCA